MTELPKIDSPIIRSIADGVSQDIRTAIVNDQIRSVQDVRNYVYDNFLSFFKEIGNNPFIPDTYSEYDHRDQLKFNTNTVAIDSVIKLLFEEVVELKDLIVLQSNLLVNSSEDITLDIGSITSELDQIEEVIEVNQFISRGRTVTTIFDNFADLSKTDNSRSSSVGNVIFNHGLELRALSDVNRASAVLDIKVSAEGVERRRPTSGGSSSNLKDPNDKLDMYPVPYEGKRFGNIGDIRPEGGKWRIESINSKVDSADPVIEGGLLYTNLASKEYGGNNILGRNLKLKAPFNGKTYELEGQTVIKSKVSKSIWYYRGTTKSTKTTREEANELVKEFNASHSSIGNKFKVKSQKVVRVRLGNRRYGFFGPRRNATAVIETTTTTYKPNVRITSSDLFLESTADADNIRYPESTTTDPYANTITRDDLAYVEQKATEVDLLANRFKMFDNNNETFWEIEYTPSLSEIENALTLDAEATGSAEATFTNAHAITSNTLSEYNQESAGTDEDYLDVALTIILDKPYKMNYLTLDPVIFGDSITNYTTTILSITVFGPNILEGMNVLDEESDLSISSNDSLDDDTLAKLGRSSRFSFKGRGVWPLPTESDISKIEVTLRQSDAIANPYQLKEVQLLLKTTKTISQSVSVSRSSGNWFSSSSSSQSGSDSVRERGRFTKLVQFGYLETILDYVSSGVNTGLLSGVSSGSDVSTGTGPVGSESSRGFGILSFLFGSSSSSSSSSNNTQESSTGYQVNHERYKTDWSRARYALGIRELGLHSKVFAESCVHVSTPTTVRVGGKEITLEVDVIVPVEFKEYDPSVNWVEYFVLINDSPYQIYPVLGAEAQFGTSGVLPSSVILDQVTSGEFAELRFMVKMKRPSENDLVNADSYTTILKKYKINIIETS